MIELQEIRKAFNQGRENEFHALNGISLTLPAQRVTALRGPSGSGKTTLLSIIGCLSRPTILEQLPAVGRTVILTSHDPLVVDSSLVHQVVDLRDGRIVPSQPASGR